MQIQHGCAVMYDRETGHVFKEENVFSCCHCHRKVHTATLRSHQFRTCFSCDDGTGRGLICNSPECNERCAPFMKKLEAAEAIARFRRMI